MGGTNILVQKGGFRRLIRMSGLGIVDRRFHATDPCHPGFVPVSSCQLHSLLQNLVITFPSKDPRNHTSQTSSPSYTTPRYSRQAMQAKLGALNQQARSMATAVKAAAQAKLSAKAQAKAKARAQTRGRARHVRRALRAHLRWFGLSGRRNHLSAVGRT